MGYHGGEIWNGWLIIGAVHRRAGLGLSLMAFLSLLKTIILSLYIIPLAFAMVFEKITDFLINRIQKVHVRVINSWE